MASNDSTSNPDLSVVFQVAGQSYALPHDAVLEMVQPPPIVPLPAAPTWVRGVVNLRGRVMGLLDLRLALGLPSAQAETNELMEELVKREKEHRAWLAELEAAIQEERDFTLTTDPHACAFGRWFDNFETTHVVLAQVVSRMDEPHRCIHGVAKKTIALMKDGQQQEALDILEKTRHGELAQLIALLGETKTTLQTTRREIAVIVQSEQGAIAVQVDQVDSIEAVKRDSGDCAYDSASPLIEGIATNANDDLVLMLDPARLVGLFQTRNAA